MQNEDKLKVFGSPSECVEYLEKKYNVRFTNPLIGNKTNKLMFNNGWVIGEQTEDQKIRYRIDYDEKEIDHDERKFMGMHINYEGGKYGEYEHCLIKNYIIKNEKFEYWNALHKKYKIPCPS